MRSTQGEEVLYKVTTKFAVQVAKRKSHPEVFSKVLEGPERRYLRYHCEDVNKHGTKCVRLSVRNAAAVPLRCILCHVAGSRV